jgi:hypothetical protein
LAATVTTLIGVDPGSSRRTPSDHCRYLPANARTLPKLGQLRLTEICGTQITAAYRELMAERARDRPAQKPR